MNKIINFKLRKDLKERQAAAEKMKTDRQQSVHRILEYAKLLKWGTDSSTDEEH